MVKYCVANECPIRTKACAWAARCGHLEVLKYLREEAKVPWDPATALWRLEVVISTYSNILLSVSMINMTIMRVSWRRVRPLGLFEVLARNRQSALGFGYCLYSADNGHLHILEYLVERKYDEYDESVSVGGRKRSLRLFEVLARNRQSALGRLRLSRCAQEQTPRMCTIPPRQRLSVVTRRLADT